MLGRIQSKKIPTWQDFVDFVSNDIWGGCAGSSQVNTIFLNTDDIYMYWVSANWWYKQSVLIIRRPLFYWIYKFPLCARSYYYFCKNICKMQTFLQKQKLIEHLFFRIYYDFRLTRDHGHEQLFSSGGWFKGTVAWDIFSLIASYLG